jgi:hypothetical protein
MSIQLWPDSLFGLSFIPQLDERLEVQFDTRKEMRCNIEDVITENEDRFLEPDCGMDAYAIQTFLKGAIDNARERVGRYYKTPIHNTIEVVCNFCCHSVAVTTPLTLHLSWRISSRFIGRQPA